MVAENYVQLIINKKGDWGGASTATVSAMEPFTRDGRTLGYPFYVEPQGCVLVSLCKEQSPVKAYSARSTLNPDSESGLTDLLKARLLRAITYFEAEAGKPIDQLTRKDWDAIIDTDYRPAWVVLTDPEFDVTWYHTEKRAGRRAWTTRKVKFYWPPTGISSHPTTINARTWAVVGPTMAATTRTPAWVVSPPPECRSFATGTGRRVESTGIMSTRSTGRTCPTR